MMQNSTHSLATLCNYHTIAITKKSVSLGDSVLVCGAQYIPASKCRSEHEDGAFWQMKVCNQRINYLKFIARIDKYIRFAGDVVRRFVQDFLVSIFKRACHCCTECNNAVVASLCGLDCSYGGGRY